MQVSVKCGEGLATSASLTEVVILIGESKADKAHARRFATKRAPSIQMAEVPSRTWRDRSATRPLAQFE